jgi:hypothetical protein
MLPLVRAQTYGQPMVGTSWNMRAILVSVPNSPSWARDTIYQALDSWNKAQSWFLQNYEPCQTNFEYALVIAGTTPAQVTVHFVNDTGQSWTGLTQVPSSGIINNETISIVLERLLSQGDLQPVIEHELGHVLGLDHTSISYDLMYPARDAYGGGTLSYPSTLNLYGVYLLAAGCRFMSGDTIALPRQIPYLEWYPEIALTAGSVNPPVTVTLPATAVSCPRSSTTPTYGSFFLIAIGIITGAIMYSWRRRRRNIRVRAC